MFKNSVSITTNEIKLGQINESKTNIKAKITALKPTVATFRGNQFHLKRDDDDDDDELSVSQRKPISQITSDFSTKHRAKKIQEVK